MRFEASGLANFFLEFLFQVQVALVAGPVTFFRWYSNFLWLVFFFRPAIHGVPVNPPCVPPSPGSQTPQSQAPPPEKLSQKFFTPVVRFVSRIFNPPLLERTTASGPLLCKTFILPKCPLRSCLTPISPLMISFIPNIP